MGFLFNYEIVIPVNLNEVDISIANDKVKKAAEVIS